MIYSPAFPLIPREVISSTLFKPRLVVHARKVPLIEYLSADCSFTCAAPSLNVPSVMSEPGVHCKQDAGRMEEAVEAEAEILGSDVSRDEAVESSPAAEEEKLPKLSSRDFQVYNSMAEHMDYFHNHFRQTWNILYG